MVDWMEAVNRCSHVTHAHLIDIAFPAERVSVGMWITRPLARMHTADPRELRARRPDGAGVPVTRVVRVT
ncbi:MAG: hypothetical protein IPG72_02440 [Ardenticatenales bacterium]|jgi:hypothetical protein|nr:hypothetical protein [Ardenticatenales bacterium]